MKTSVFNCIFSLILVAFLSLSVVACIEDSDDDNQNADGDTEESGETDVEAEKEVNKNQVATPVKPDSWVTEDKMKPNKVHMTYQKDPSTSITITWSVKNKKIEELKPKVWYVKEDELDSPDSIMPFSRKYVTEGECYIYVESVIPVEPDPTLDDEYKLVICNVELTDLEPKTKYFYRAGFFEDFSFEELSFDMPNFSKRSHFVTGAKKGDRSKFSFVHAGDSRGGYDKIAQNIEWLRDKKAAFWMFNGDMTDLGMQNQWDEWFAAMRPLLIETSLMPVQGNHEGFAGVYFDQFQLPKEKELPEDLHEHGWSFIYGNLFVIGLGSNTKNIIEGQKDWLEHILKRASEDKDIDWIITMSHKPVYSAGSHGSTEELQEHWMPLFEKYGVDISFSGHDHHYERSKPWLAGKEADEGGIRYIVAGGFGAPAYGVDETKEWLEVAHHGEVGNSVHVEVDGKQMKITALSGDGQTVLDEFTLNK